MTRKTVGLLGLGLLVVGGCSTVGGDIKKRDAAAGGGGSGATFETWVPLPTIDSSSSSSSSSSSGCRGVWCIGPGGYVTSWGWHGYAWPLSTGDGGTVSPNDFSALTGDTRLCVSGTVAVTSDGSGSAILGVNVNQETGTSTVAESSPIGSGIHYSLTNPGGTAIRIQLQTTDGADNPNHRWCADVPSLTGTIAWSTFNTQCWPGGTGKAYDGQTPISAVLFIVPGSNTVVVPYNFCLNSLYQAALPNP